MSAYGPVAIEIIKKAVDEAWASLNDDEQQIATRSDLAVRVLAAAADGELDHEKLVAAALKHRQLN